MGIKEALGWEKVKLEGTTYSLYVFCVCLCSANLSSCLNTSMVFKEALLL
jgi:hypothetical protein